MWQNLIYKKCPVCDGRLKPTKDKTLRFACEEKNCSFVITARAYAEILADENHIIRRYLTTEERKLLETALDESLNPEYGGKKLSTGRGMDKVV